MRKETVCSSHLQFARLIINCIISDSVSEEKETGPLRKSWCCWPFTCKILDYNKKTKPVKVVPNELIWLLLIKKVFRNRSNKLLLLLKNPSASAGDRGLMPDQEDPIC